MRRGEAWAATKARADDLFARRGKEGYLNEIQRKRQKYGEGGVDALYALERTSANPRKNVGWPGQYPDVAQMDLFSL